MRRVLPWLVGIVVLVGFLGSGILQNESRVEADEYEKVRALQAKLEARGFDAASIEIRGDRVTLLRASTPEYDVEDEVAKWAAFRAAAEEGYSWIEFGTVVSGPTEGMQLRLQQVPRVDREKSAALISAWVAELDGRTGAKTEASYVDYRLDLQVEAPSGLVGSVAEHFMDGGVVQHEAGALEILTIVITSGGEVLFKGVADYNVGVRARVYVAPSLSHDW